MAVYRSARGTPVDLDKLRLKSEDNISVGNTKTNARGDVLGKGGRVEKSADEIAREHYNRNNPKAVKRASIKVDEDKKSNSKPMEDDWLEPTTVKSDNVVTDTVEGDVEWVEDDEGNFVKKEDLE